MKNTNITIDEVLGKQRKLHWKFLAYERRLDDGNISGVVEVIVNHYTNEADALNAVKGIAVRPLYFLKEVWECTQCQTQDEQKEMFRIFKKYLGS